MSHAHDPADDAGPRRARDLFARASAGLDHGIAFRLRRARLQATQPAAPRRPEFSGWLPAGLAAAAALAVAVTLWLPATPTPAPTPAATAVAAATVDDQQEIEQLLAGDEDPELYAWLAEAPVAVAARGTP